MEGFGVEEPIDGPDVDGGVWRISCIDIKVRVRVLVYYGSRYALVGQQTLLIT